MTKYNWNFAPRRSWMAGGPRSALRMVLVAAAIGAALLALVALTPAAFVASVFPAAAPLRLAIRQKAKAAAGMLPFGAQRPLADPDSTNVISMSQASGRGGAAGRGAA